MTDFSNKEEICEKLDDTIYYHFDNMKKCFNLNQENIELFKLFFFACLDNIEEWNTSIVKFGKDFLHTKDFLRECFEKLFYFQIE